MKMIWIIPNIPLPANVTACSTTRYGGVSEAPYNSLNLGEHVGDSPIAVKENRRRLGQTLLLPTEPTWLEQTHSTRVLVLDGSEPTDIQADAAYSRVAGQVCTVMTADCLPVLFCSHSGDEVAAAHAGWRGLCDGVLESTLQHFQAARKQIMAWLGPSIGPQQFEVGGEVREQFLRHHQLAEQAFIARGNKYLADIHLLAEIRLRAAGIQDIYREPRCTVSEPQCFFSYRRDGVTGRMASLIWFQ